MSDASAASGFPIPPDVAPEQTLRPAQWGMLSFLLSEVAFFGTLIVTYIYYLGKDTVGPTPADALSLHIVAGTTLCLLASSFTIHLAEGALRRDQGGAFQLLWAATIVLALLFLGGTAYEWRDLMRGNPLTGAPPLTISRNLFGTTFYTLVGFHALHVSIGVVAMLIVLLLALRRRVTAASHEGVQLVGWYWHFVDGVWVVVFIVVYIVGR